MKAAIHKNKSLGFPVVVWVVALAVTLTASWAAAQTETTLPAVQSGLIGIARAQTARLNVVHLMPFDPDYPPNPCMATLMFLNEQVRSSATGPAIQLPQGWISFPATRPFSSFAPRMPLRAARP